MNLPLVPLFTNLQHSAWFPAPQGCRSAPEVSLTRRSYPSTESHSPRLGPREQYFCTNPSSDSDARPGLETTVEKHQPLWPALGPIKKGLSFLNSQLLAFGPLPDLPGSPNTGLLRIIFFPCTLSGCSINSTQQWICWNVHPSLVLNNTPSH